MKEHDSQSLGKLLLPACYLWIMKHIAHTVREWGNKSQAASWDHSNEEMGSEAIGNDGPAIYFYITYWS